jgi:sugar phosphate isomerase/epimerase
MKIGIRIDPLRLPLRDALTFAGKAGATGVQVDAVGELSPQRLTQTGRRELRILLRSNNLELTALGCPLRFGIDTRENQQARIEHLANAMTLAYDLGSRVIIVEMPRIPGEGDLETDRGNRLRESLVELGRHGDRIGTQLALETGLDTGDKLNEYLATFECGSLGVNYDPANMLLNGHDPVANLIPLHERLVHTHARDAARSRSSRGAGEVRMGAGDIDWMTYFATLSTIRYQGWVVVEREPVSDCQSDLIQGIAFVRRFLPAAIRL